MILADAGARMPCVPSHYYNNLCNTSLSAYEAKATRVRHLDVDHYIC